MARKSVETVEDAIALGGSAFSRWLQKEMKRSDKTINDICGESGVSWPTIYNIVNGITPNPQRATKQKIADSLQIKIPAQVNSEIAKESVIVGIGELIDFDPHNSSELPPISGVYVFYDIAGRPLYIGRSKNISRRVAEHSDKFWFKAPLVQTGAYIQIENDTLQMQVEQILIKFLKNNAVINKQKVDRKN